MNYSVEISHNNDEWCDLIINSEQGHIFSDIRFLNSLGVNSVIYIVRSVNKEVVGGVAIIEEQPGQMCKNPYPFTPYQGVVIRNPRKNEQYYKKVEREFQITKVLLDRVCLDYKDINMVLSPYFNDVRPFSWFNYDEPSLSKFSASISYTGLLNLKDFDFELYIKSIKSSRLQEFRKSKALIIEDNNISKLIDLYRLMFSRQNIEIPKKNLNLLENITFSALSQGYGRLTSAKLDGHVVSMSLFLHDQNHAYFLIGANHPESRSSGSSSALIIENMIEFSNRGLKTLDLVGLNSPQRAYFKLSFNPELKPYYRMYM